MRSEDGGDEEEKKKEEEQNGKKVDRSGRGRGGGEGEEGKEFEKSRGGESDWEVDEVDAGAAEVTGEMFEDNEEGKTKPWFKGLMGKRSNKKELGRSSIGWEEFDLEEINSKSCEEDEELVVFDKYKETGLYVNKLNTHLEEGGAKNPRQRVNSAENEDVKRVKSEETQDEDGWDWREVGEGEEVEVGDTKEVASSSTTTKKKKNIGRKKSCRQGFHVTACKCKPLALLADTSI